LERILRAFDRAVRPVLAGFEYLGKEKAQRVFEIAARFWITGMCLPDCLLGG
jgi:hypothetical protein